MALLFLSQAQDRARPQGRKAEAPGLQRWAGTAGPVRPLFTEGTLVSPATFHAQSMHSRPRSTKNIGSMPGPNTPAASHAAERSQLPPGSTRTLQGPGSPSPCRERAERGPLRSSNPLQSRACRNRACKAGIQKSSVQSRRAHGSCVHWPACTARVHSRACTGSQDWNKIGTARDSAEQGGELAPPPSRASAGVAVQTGQLRLRVYGHRA